VSEISIEELEAEQSMFVQTAQGITRMDGTLTLNGVSPSTLYFSDRPQRVVGHMATTDFVDLWGEGDNSFESDPPQRRTVVPRLRGRRAPGYRDRDKGAPARKRPVVLVDRRPGGERPRSDRAGHPVHRPFGRPLSLVSVCGVRRRERRRARRRI
jgi:hypothetical protein